MLNSPSWEKNYKLLGRYNKYPFDFIVSYTKKYFKDGKNLKSLDLGCGGGNNIKFLQEENFNIFGVDYSKTSIKLTKSVIKKKYRNQIICGDFKNLPFKNHFFDLIIDRMSVTHNSENDIENIIAEVGRVMKKNAILISSFHSRNNPDLKYGQKKGDTYFNFKKGNFKHSNVVYAPNEDILRNKFKKFKILDLKEYRTVDLIKKKLETTFHVIVLSKK
jgi:SAM-dependent methyltransferase